MSLFKEVKSLLYKEILLEFKQKFAIYGIIMYAFSMVFVVSLAFHKTLEPQLWNILFWVLMLFIAVTTVAKSFLGENSGQILYSYQLTSPNALLISKVIYYTTLLGVLALLSLFGYMALVGNPCQDLSLYLGAMGLGVLSMASILSIVAAIASSASAKSTLMSVLSFPLLIPQLLTTIRLCALAMNGRWGSSESLTLIALTGIIWTVSLLVFPFLWKE